LAGKIDKDRKSKIEKIKVEKKLKLQEGGIKSIK